MDHLRAMGIDPARQVNYGVAMVYPEKILLSRSFPTTWRGTVGCDEDVYRIAKERDLTITSGVQGGNHTAFPLCQILLQRGRRDIRDVNPYQGQSPQRLLRGGHIRSR